MSDTLKGYTVAVTRAGGITLKCDRCDELAGLGDRFQLLDLVALATEHSGRCLG